MVTTNAMSMSRLRIKYQLAPASSTCHVWCWLPCRRIGPRRPAEGGGGGDAVRTGITDGAGGVGVFAVLRNGAAMSLPGISGGTGGGVGCCTRTGDAEE